MPQLLAICIRQTDNDLIAAECRSLTGGTPDDNGVAVCQTLAAVERSSYIRHGVQVIAQSASFDGLTAAIRQAEFDATDFRIEWMKHSTSVEIGRKEAIVGVADAIALYYPNLDQPGHRFLLLANDEGFTFGEIVADSNRGYQRHLSKPYRTSSALPPRLARGAINIASATACSLIDPCCGSGTIPIEAASIGMTPRAADRDPLAAQITRANLEYFGYAGTVDVCEGAEWNREGDVLVTDLPYGINLRATEQASLEALLANAARLAPVGVFLAADNLAEELQAAGFAEIEVFHHRTQSTGNPLTRVVHRARSAVFEDKN